jgi:peptidyl-tRNA hydrolase
MNDNTPVLFIIMRNDMASLNPGKACAAAAHAANHAAHVLGKPKLLGNYTKYQEWASQTSQQFGTTIVLEANNATILSVLDHAFSDGVDCDCIIDPTYPIRDGEVTHLITIMTCAWLFGTKEELEEYVGHLPLMR